MKKNYFIFALIPALALVLSASDAVAQYCSPTMGTYWGWINDVKSTGAVQNFTNVTGPLQSPGRGQYNDYTNSHGVITFPGQTITFSGQRSYAMDLWIDWNADGDFNDAGENVYSETNTSSQLRTFSFNITVPATAAVGKETRMRFYTGYYFYKNPCGYQRTFGSFTSYYGGEAEDYSLFITYDNNAGVTGLSAPLAECKGTAGNDVSIYFRNSGVLDLDTCYFGGVIKTGGSTSITTPIPTKMWTGNLKTGEEVDPAFQLFTYPSVFKAGDTVCIWSFNPNNVPDSATSDDTLCYVIKGGIEGTYTVGDTTGGAHDFRSLTDAVDFINAAGAICDSVIVEIMDTSYAVQYGQYELKDILGTSPTSPIIFKSMTSMNMHRPICLFDSCTEDYNYLFKLHNMTDVYFDGIDFYTATSKSPSHSRVFEIDNCERVYFNDLRVENDIRTVNNANHNLISVLNSSDVGLWESNLINGSNSIVASGGSDLHVEGNSFTNMYENSINVSQYENVWVVDNEFISNSLRAGGRAINLTEVDRTIEVSYNSVWASVGQWPLIGLNMETCNALNSSSEVYNNVFNIGRSWSSATYYGVRMVNVVGTSVVFNTLSASGNNANNSALYSNNGTRNTAYNNILAVPVNGIALYTPVAASIVAGDNNNLYAPTGSVGRLGNNSFTSVSAWNNATGLDANSMNVNPFFYNLAQNDLHVCNDKLFGAAIPIAGITDDWEGDIRDANTPCIGADEFAPVSLFSLGMDEGLCDGDSTFLVAGKGLTGELAIWENIGTGQIDTGQVLTVKTPGFYQGTLLNACGISVDTIEIITPAKVALPADSNLCPAASMMVDASITNGNKYVWNTGATTAQITVTMEGPYMVTTTDKWGCNSEDSMYVSYSNSANLSTQNDTIVCEGQAFGLFGGTDPNTNPVATYRWFGFTGADLETGANIFVDYLLLDSDDTTIVCELTHNGCVTTDSLNVSKKPAPRIQNVTYSVNGMALYINSNSSTGENHNWDFGDTNSSMWDAPRHVYSQAGKYIVSYTNSNICGSVDTSFEVSIMGLSIAENGIAGRMNVYPNPSNGTFNLSFDDVNADDVSYSIVDAQGRIVTAKEIGRVSGSAVEQINLNVTSGIYVLRIEVDGQVVHSRITIE